MNIAKQQNIAALKSFYLLASNDSAKELPPIGIPLDLDC